MNYEIFVEVRDWVNVIATILLPVILIKLAPKMTEQIVAGLKRDRHSQLIDELKGIFAAIGEEIDAHHKAFDAKARGKDNEVPAATVKAERAFCREVQDKLNNALRAYRDAIPHSGEVTIAHFARSHEISDMLDAFHDWCDTSDKEWLSGTKIVSQASMNKHWDQFRSKTSEILRKVEQYK